MLNKHKKGRVNKNHFSWPSHYTAAVCEQHIVNCYLTVTAVFLHKTLYSIVSKVFMDLKRTLQKANLETYIVDSSF